MFTPGPIPPLPKGNIKRQDELQDLDCVIVAVAHREFVGMGLTGVLKMMRDPKHAVVIDVKGIYSCEELNDAGVVWWRL